MRKDAVVVEVWKGVASPVSAPHGAVLVIRNIDTKEEVTYRMNVDTWALLETKELGSLGSSLEDVEEAANQVMRNWEDGEVAQ
jgi:hypothetical protein